MNRHRVLAAVSVAQLATGVAGMVVALRRRHPYDVFWMHGHADSIARDSIVKGTAFSAPVTNLMIQAALTAVVARRPSRRAVRALGGLGALMVAGYAGERLVRRRLRPSGWDAVESPLVVVGMALAGAMAALGSRPDVQDGGSPVREGVLAGGLPYLAVGEGPPLIVFPGLTAENANPTGLTRWLELQTHKPLAGQFTVYAVCRRPGLAPGSTISDLSDQYAEALAAEFEEPVSIEGISTGGSVALQFAIDHPDLVLRLVVVAAASRLSPRGREVQRRVAELIEAGKPQRAYAAMAPAIAATATGGRFLAVLMWLLGGIQPAADHSDMLVTIAAEDVFNASPELHRIQVPTLVIAGERDGFYSAELFRETADGIPGARLRLYPGKGHGGTLTHKPAVREILEFLTG